MQLALTTVLEVLQAVSGQTDLEPLMGEIMRLGLEQSGAERGLLILENDDGLRVAAEAAVSSGSLRISAQESAVSGEALSEAVYSQVLRTNEIVLLHDASTEGVFARDEYLRRHHVRSVVCMPLLRQATPVGLIYFEHRATPGVFTPERIAVLTVLASEAAVSLERARLHRELHVREARLRELNDSTRSAQAAKRESEREARLIVESIPGMVALLTASGEVETANPTLLEYFGLPLEELRQWGTNGMIHPEDLPHVIEVFVPSIASGTPYVIEQRIRRADGIFRWLENRGFPVRDTNGRITRWCVLLTDVDDRKHAEDALRESERDSRLIVDSIPGLIAVFTPSGEVENVNRQALEYFGKTLEELKEWGSSDSTHPDDRARVIDLFTRAMTSGLPFDWQSRARRFDGVYRWVQTRGYPLRDAGGRIVRWYNLIIDIDERKRAEDALAASERTLQVTVDTIPALAWSTGPDGAADFFNQHYLDFVGLSAAQASGWGWTTVVHPDDLPGLAARWQHIMASEVAGEMEARMRRRDGEYRWLLCRVNPLRDDSGAIVRWYGVNTDIEDRKRAEVELRQAYDSVADAQRLSRTGSFVTDLEGDDHHWSEETYRIFELDPATVITVQGIRTILHPEDLAAFDAMIARALSGANVTFAFRIVTARGALKHVRAVAHVIERIGGRPMLVGALQDVTETVVAEAALDRARSELAHVARVTSIGMLTASITHEVNQPLAGIITNASTCLRMLDADPPNVEGARETARRTIRDGHRAADVVTRLRSLFSKREPTLEPLDLNEAVREVMMLTLGDLQRNRVALRSELADDLPPVIGDRVELQQVVVNLVLNASEAMTEVNDRPRQLLVRTEPVDDVSVRLVVRDSGAGIDPRHRDRLFEPFYTTKNGGMGIGLSVSRSIVERHRGRLWVEPNEGPGATFALTLPRRAEQAADTKV